MEKHVLEINQFCRLCKSLVAKSYAVQTFTEELNFIYRDEGVDVSKDDPQCQSKQICRSCYLKVKKAQEAISYMRKNPKSKKTYNFNLPAYSDNVTVFKYQRTAEPVPDQPAIVGATPSKVRKLSGEALQSPSDKLTARQRKLKTPERRSIKFDLEKYQTNFRTGGLDLTRHDVVKIYTSQDSVPMERVRNQAVAQFFACRVCSNFPKAAKVSATCAHIYCKVCIENYKDKINSTKCPPPHAFGGGEEDLEERCNIPARSEDIVEVAGLLKDIQQSLKIACGNQNCDQFFSVQELSDHEKTCKARGFYHKDHISLSTTHSVILQRESSKTINLVLEWCKSYDTAPCDFLLFALKRLIRSEAPELEESVHKLFKLYLKEVNEADLVVGLTAIDGLALKTDTDLSNVQYQKLRMNREFGSKLPSLARVTKEKQMLDPGNVSYSVFNRINGELIKDHEALPDSGIIDVEEDLANFSYGDLNINIRKDV